MEYLLAVAGYTVVIDPQSSEGQGRESVRKSVMRRLTLSGRSHMGRWPASGMTIRCEPGMVWCRASPADRGRKRSSRPQMSSVGAVTELSRGAYPVSHSSTYRSEDHRGWALPYCLRSR